MRIVECPVCHTSLEAYESQINGSQSMVCPVDGAHFYADGRTIPTALPLVDIERFMPGSPRYNPCRVPELDQQTRLHAIPRETVVLVSDSSPGLGLLVAGALAAALVLHGEAARRSKR